MTLTNTFSLDASIPKTRAFHTGDGEDEPVYMKSSRKNSNKNTPNKNGGTKNILSNIRLRNLDLPKVGPSFANSRL